YMVGKWHLGLGEKGKKIDWNKHIAPSPNEIGFDESFIFAATGDRVPCVILENGNVRNLDPNDPIEVSYQHNFPGLPNGKDNKDQLKLMWSHGHNQAVINGIGRIGFMKGGKSALWKDEENADVITDKAIEYIHKSAKAKEPFFLMFATHDIHVPRCPEKRFVGKSQHGVRGDVTVELDECVSRITEACKKAGLERTPCDFPATTALCWTTATRISPSGDNATHSPAGPFRAGKYSILEGGSRIPFIVKWPSVIKPGTTSKALLNQMDLGPPWNSSWNPASPPFRDSENVMPARWANPPRAAITTSSTAPARRWPSATANGSSFRRRSHPRRPQWTGSENEQIPERRQPV
ncbi:MAG: sulfatase-like hydrolase/transferase, partial [Akkermansia sp.]